MTALHYPPESIWLCGWSSGREPGKTGGAWCSHPCVPLPPATFRRRPSPGGLGEEDLSLITEEDGGYVLRFRAVELWEGLRQWLGKH